ncbi:MAG: hypothetical protein ACRDMX_11340 [Solirubrobacteraceae bacterium]
MNRDVAGWAVPTTVAAGLIAYFVLTHLPGLSGDSVALVHGAHTISYCASHDIYSYCDRLPQFVPGGFQAAAHHQIVEGAVSPYPLFQYLPAIVLSEFGVSDPAILKDLSVISLLAFCGTLALSIRLALLTRRRWTAPLVVVLITTSPLVYYAWLTFGESLAAFLVLLAATAALRRWRPTAIGLTALLACITKETAFVFIALLGGAALYATPVAARPVRRSHLAGLGCGILVGVVVNCAFDWFRYGQLTNYTYDHSYTRVPGLVHRLALSVALWLSPNGGVAWFWLPGTAVVVLIVMIAASGLHRRAFRARTGSATALVVALLLLTGTLASWFAPFGWAAWGPRLMMPIVPPVVVTAVILYGAKIEQFLAWLTHHVFWTMLLAGVTIAFGLPEVNVLHAPQIVGALFLPDATCPNPAGANVMVDPRYYYHCIDHWAWGSHSVLLSSFHALDQVSGSVYGVVFAVLWTWLLVSVTAAPHGARSRLSAGLSRRRAVSGDEVGMG